MFVRKDRNQPQPWSSSWLNARTKRRSTSNLFCLNVLNMILFLQLNFCTWVGCGPGGRAAKVWCLGNKFESLGAKDGTAQCPFTERVSPRYNT